MNKINFTLVTTVFNEINRLEQTILDIENQTLKPNEIIITDAGSKDGTYERLKDWSIKSNLSIRILQKIKCNVAEGRNFAIENTSNQLIVSTDFGCRFHPDWLQSIVTPFNNPSVKVVGGAFTVMETEIQTLSSKAAYILNNGYLCNLDDHFIPSSRSIAYFKEIWDQVGGYQEWLTLAADDLVFGLTLKNKNIPITLIDKPYVYWGRHVKSEAYGKEAFRYGMGDGEAQVNLRNFISNCLETALRWGLFLFIILFLIYTLIYSPNYVILFLMTPLVFGLRSYLNALKNWTRIKSEKYNISTLFYSFYLIELTRFNYLKGYLKGLFNKTKEQEFGVKALKATL